jgi:hypothetical protein
MRRNLTLVSAEFGWTRRPAKSQTTVAKYMVRHRKPPSQSWRTFLKNHARDLVSADFFVVPTIAFQLLFVFVILDHDRRRPIHFAVTSKLTPRQNGQPINFWKHSPGTRPRVTCCGTAAARTERSSVTRRNAWQNEPFAMRSLAAGFLSKPARGLTLDATGMEYGSHR